MKPITPHDEKLMVDIIDRIGKMTRKRIRLLPEHVQDAAWASIAAAIVGAALNDSTEPWKVLHIVTGVFTAMMPSEDIKKVGAMILDEAMARRRPS